MSFQALNWCTGKANSSGEQLVLLMLANYSDPYGISYVGQDQLAEDCSASRTMVQANLTRLEEAGLIRRFRRHTGKGRRTSDVVVVAPNWQDRGEIKDADKITASIHPEHICAAARQSSDSGLGGVDEARISTDQGSDSDEPRPGFRARTVSRTASRTTASPSNRARGRTDELPEDFPEHLLPHARKVYCILRRTARRHNGNAISITSLGHTIMARRHKPLVRAAYDYAAWLESRARNRKDFVAGYRNWLDRTDDLEGYEQLDEESEPASRPDLKLAHSLRPRSATQIKEQRREEAADRAHAAWKRMQAAKEAS